MKYLNLFAGLLFISTTTPAQPNVQVKGHVIVPLIEKKDPSTSNHAAIQKPAKYIKIMKIELSPQAKRNLKAQSNTTPIVSMAGISQSSAQLGMGKVPVLDQGPHGTCVTFAMTAALDAALNRGDYISQLCSLQLGNTLSEHSYHDSGWDGSFGPHVYHQIQAFGLVNKKKQQEIGCGGIQSYPKSSAEPQASMTLSEHHGLSEKLPDSIFATHILDAEERFEDAAYSTQRTLHAVKKALLHHNRLVIGSLLVGVSQGEMGALGTYHQTNDTWLLASETLAAEDSDDDDIGGHEMIITGFDDNAIAIDSQGKKHQGLLTLRNSWGPRAGDNGNYYMSYDYFKRYILEVMQVHAG